MALISKFLIDALGPTFSEKLEALEES